MIEKILDTLFPSRVRTRVERENRLEEIRFNKFLEDKKKREDMLTSNGIVDMPFLHPIS